jgi:hypothetical protein
MSTAEILPVAVALAALVVASGLIAGWLVAANRDPGTPSASPLGLYEVHFRGVASEDDALLVEWATARMFPGPCACRRLDGPRRGSLTVLARSDTPPDPGRLGPILDGRGGWLRLLRRGRDRLEFAYADPTLRPRARLEHERA